MGANKTVTTCRTPAEGRNGIVNIPTWKFDLVRAAVLQILADAGSDGLHFNALPDAVRSKLTTKQLETLGSVGWHITTVKLEMEVAKEIKRIPNVSPQRLVIAGDR